MLERRETVEKLGNSRDPRVVEPLINSLKNDDWGVRKAAAEAINGFMIIMKAEKEPTSSPMQPWLPAQYWLWE